MKHSNNGVWDNLYPITFEDNVLDSEGVTAGEKFKSFNNSLLALNEDISHLFKTEQEQPINVKNPPKEYQHLALKGDNTTDDSDNLQALINIGRPLYFPTGTYRLEKTITLKKINFIGDSAYTVTFNFVNPGHGFVIEPGTFTSRSSVYIGRFSIMGSANGLGDYYAFYMKGLSERPIVYNFGANFDSIEIENFGGGFYVEDFFRLNVTRIGMSHVGNPIRINGSVVQSTFDTITNNGDFAPRGAIPHTGIMTRYKTYDDGVIMVPESVKFMNFSTTEVDYGIDHQAGLFITFQNVDLDFIHDTGILFGAEALVDNFYIATSNSGSKVTGVKFDVMDLTRPYVKTLKNGIIRSYTSLHKDSVAIAYGDEGQSPYREEWGGVIERVRIEGGPWKYGIMADRHKSIVIRDCYIHEGACTNTEIVLSNAKLSIVEGNLLPGGEINVSSPFTNSAGKIKYNHATVTTSDMASTNWEIENNY